MIDYIEIASAPIDECCAQTGFPGYKHRAWIECKAFKQQLIRKFGQPPEGARLAVKSFPHDFGTYYEVVCYYNTDNRQATDYAFKLEDETPEKWDNEAKEFINQHKDCKCSL